ncbi:MAG: class I SAM-dependent methyltransferase [Sporichthyaceae bacterium]
MAWIQVRLEGVPETALWTLYHRAMHAAQPNSGLDDPKAIELVTSIDFPFRRQFGPDLVGLTQVVGQRARTFDHEVLSVLATDPEAKVVVLGEGFETQFWRVDNGRVHWLSVDLPAVAAPRLELLGEDPPRRRVWGGSALSDRWLDELGAKPDDRVVVVAQGLLMYLQPDEVYKLIARCAEAFPGGVMLFDVVPKWFSVLSSHGFLASPGGYVAPPMPWGMDAGQHRRIVELHPNIAAVRTVVPPPSGGTLAGLVMPVGRRVPLLRRGLPEVVRLDFAR